MSHGGVDLLMEAAVHWKTSRSPRWEQFNAPHWELRPSEWFGVRSRDCESSPAVGAIKLFLKLALPVKLMMWLQS